MIGIVTKARVLRAATIFRERAISQAEVAAIVGASRPQISRIFKGFHVVALGSVDIRGHQ